MVTIAAMSFVGLVFAGLAAILHFFIFCLESLVWESERARKVFKNSVEEAQATKAMALNQGFYNLMLAAVTAVGIALWPISNAVGTALVLAGTGSMLAAALLLGLSSPPHRSAALRQGTLPLLAVALVLLGLP